MSNFFYQTLVSRLSEGKSRFRKHKQSQRKGARGKKHYDPLKMFKAILLGQWHSLSDEALEHALMVRADFIVFCQFDDMDVPECTKPHEANHLRIHKGSTTNSSKSIAMSLNNALVT